MDCSFGERVVIMPRRFAYPLRDGEVLKEHYAVIGMAAVQNEQPLFYDGINEHGLFAAGLEFPKSARYIKAAGAKHGIASFDVIPKLLSTCASVNEAEAMLWDAVISDAAFSGELVPAPLHWIIADKERCIAAEPTSAGLEIHENAAGVLANEPHLPFHLLNMAQYMGLSSAPPENRFAPEIMLSQFSKGMGAVGLPGDWSSPSRFVRAAFAKFNSVCGEECDDIEQFFRIMGTVAQVRGCVRLGEGKYTRTVYTSCCDGEKGIYYYSTYEDGAVRSVDMHKTDMGGTMLTEFALERRGITPQN